MSYIGTEPKDIRSFGRTKFDYTATQGQTAFTGADDDGKVLAFTVGQIEVYVNGILMDDSDFSTTGTGTVTLASAANLNDVVNVVSFETNIPDSNYVPATGGTFSGDVDFDGSFTSKGIDDNATSTTMTLDSSGNVLVGKTSNTFSNTGVALSPTGSHNMTRDGDPPLSLNRLTSDGSILNIFKDGSTVGSIGVIASDVLYIATPDGTGVGLNFDGDSPKINPSNGTGAGTDGVADLGNSSGRFKDLYLSGGAYLGGTGAANHLDDYEEGTWTPVITGQGGSTNATMTLSGRTYTKVGSLVVANAYLTSVNMGAITNGTYFIMTGFPFVAREYADFSISYKDGDHSASTTISGGYVQKNTSYAYFVTASNGAEPQQTGSAAFNRAMITFVYLTT